MKKIIYIIILCLSLFLVSCTDEEIKVKEIEIHNYEEVKIVKYNDYKLSDFEIKVTYEDGTFKIVKLDNTMVDESDLLKFSQIGEHQIYINYKGAYTAFDFEVKAIKESIGSLNIVLASDEFTYNGLAIQPAFNVLDGDKQLVSDIDYTYEYLNNVNAGIGIIRIQGIGNYSGEYNAIFTIKKADLIVKANDILIEGNEIPTFSVSYEGFKYLDTEACLMGYLLYNCNYDIDVSGEYIITPSGLSAQNYNIIYETGVLTINHIKLKDTHVSISGTSFDYTGNEIQPEIVVTIDGIRYDQESYEVTYYNNIDVGVAKVVITGKEVLTGKIEKTFTINKLNLEISVNNIEINYLDELPEYVISYKGFVTGQTVEDLDGNLNVSCNYDGTKAGIYDIILSGVSSDNYNIKFNNATLVVNKVAITELKLDYTDATYIGREIKPSFVVYRNDKVLSQNVDYEVTYSDNKNVGKAKITVKGINNFFGEISKEFTINKASLIISIDNKTIEYGDTLPEFTYTIDGFVDGDTLLNIGGVLSITSDYNGSVGNFNINGSGLASNNYKITYVKGILQVNKKEITKDKVSLVNNEFVYTGNAIKPELSINVDNMSINKNDYIVVYNNNINAGNATITIVFTGNYTGTIIKEFAIEKAQLSVVPNSYEIVYGDDIPNYQVTFNGFVNGEDINSLNGSLLYNCEYNTESNIGEYPITISGLQSINYDIAYASAKIVVKEKELTESDIILSESEFIYQGQEIKPLVIVQSEKVLVLDKDYQVEYSNNINNGEALVKVKGINNYKGEVIKTFNINKCDIEIKVNDININYLDNKPLFDVEVSGLPSTISENVVKESLVYTCDYEKGMIPGEYEITVSGFSGDNYNVNYTYGNLSVLVDSEWSGQGTIDNPYEIGSSNELYALASMVSNGYDSKDKHFILTNNIDFEGYNLISIGNQSNPFNGLFDGQGYSIKNTNIIIMSNNSVGLFGEINNAQIKNLNVDNINFEDITCINVGLIGKATYSEIDSVSVTNLNVKSKLTYDVFVGGLIGKAENTTIKDSYVSGSVNCTGETVKSTIGGLIGEGTNVNVDSTYTNIKIDVTSNTAVTAGLIAKTIDSYIYDSFVLGNITVTSDDQTTSETIGIINNSYYENILTANELNLNEIISTVKAKWSLDKWIFISDEKPLLYFEAKDNIKYVNKVDYLEMVYGSVVLDKYGYRINTKDQDVTNVGTYTVELILKDGYSWTDGTKDNLGVTLEVVPRDLYININSSIINLGDEFKVNYTISGLLDKDSNLVNELEFIWDYSSNIGTYEIFTDTSFDNYNIISNVGYLYVTDGTYNRWSIWDGTYQNSEFVGEGTEENPYQINSANDLATLAYKANNGEATNYYYVLMVNIDLNNINWPVIGNEYFMKPFNGMFNGNGYVISNLYIESNKEYLGLFGHVKNGTISNLDIINANINYVGFNDPYIGILTSFVDNSTISSSSTNGTINAKYYGTGEAVFGGLVGYIKSSSVVSNVYSNAIVNVSVLNYSKATVRTGGISGCLVDSTLEYSYSLGEINIKSDDETVNVGGLVGFATGEIMNSLYTKVNIYVTSNQEFVKINATIGCYDNSIYDIIYCDSEIMLNEDEIIDNFGELKSQEELETYISENWDQYIWDFSDISNPKLYM